jgi:hypothetical protein
MSDANDQQFVMNLEQESDASEEELGAELLLSSHGAATLAIAKTQRLVAHVPDDLSSLAVLVKKRSQTKGTGEEILQTQAMTLDFVFNQLIGRAMDETDFYAFEQMMRLAFKAQAQTRATMSAISGIRHPRVTNNIGQVNNASGHQQVNNYERAHEVNSTDEKVDPKNTPNKLSEESAGDISQNTRTSTGCTGKN